MFGLVDCNNFFVSCERVFNRRLEGRPVAVLSNNDGCVVARSAEFKALGIPLGTPYFKLRPIEKLRGLVFLSSNYELYADLSHRVMAILREYTPNLEPYSIDEAFFEIKLTDDSYAELGEQLRRRIRQWVGIPVGIGFGPTRTLAKAASKLAKKGSGVYVMPADTTEPLRDFPLADVWGVGSRLCRKLHYQGLDTALQLARQNANDIQRRYNVCLARTVLELQGVSCADPAALADPPPQSVTCSRTFGTPITRLDDLRQAFAVYASEAAQRLRAHSRLAAGATLFVQYADPQYTVFAPEQFNAASLAFPKPTANTSDILRYFAPAVATLFRYGSRHRKCGVTFFGLENAAVRQLELFDAAPAPPPLPDRLYTTVDAINARFGRNTLVSGAQGLTRPWAMRRERLSRHFTTAWDDLLVVH